MARSLFRLTDERAGEMRRVSSRETILFSTHLGINFARGADKRDSNVKFVHEYFIYLSLLSRASILVNILVIVRGLSLLRTLLYLKRLFALTLRFIKSSSHSVFVTHSICIFSRISSWNLSWCCSVGLTLSQSFSRMSLCLRGRFDLYDTTRSLSLLTFDTYPFNAVIGCLCFASGSGYQYALSCYPRLLFISNC